MTFASASLSRSYLSQLCLWVRADAWVWETLRPGRRCPRSVTPLSPTSHSSWHSVPQHSFTARLPTLVLPGYSCFRLLIPQASWMNHRNPVKPITYLRYKDGQKSRVYKYLVRFSKKSIKHGWNKKMTLMVSSCLSLVSKMTLKSRYMLVTLISHYFFASTLLTSI